LVNNRILFFYDIIRFLVAFLTVLSLGKNNLYVNNYIIMRCIKKFYLASQVEFYTYTVYDTMSK